MRKTQLHKENTPTRCVLFFVSKKENTKGVDVIKIGVEGVKSLPYISK